MKDKVLMTVPNTKDGLDAIKYLRKVLCSSGILIKIVSKKDFSQLVEETRTKTKEK